MGGAKEAERSISAGSKKRSKRRSGIKFNVKAFALTCALVWGIGLFILTWWAIAFNGSTGEVPFIGQGYHGYSISPLGGVIGPIWGFVDALIDGAIFAWLYNLLGGR